MLIYLSSHGNRGQVTKGAAIAIANRDCNRDRDRDRDGGSGSDKFDSGKVVMVTGLGRGKPHKFYTKNSE